MNSYINNQRVDISGQRVDISGQRVDISGQTIATTTLIIRNGSLQNMASNISLTSGSSTSFVNVTNYGNGSFITYEDSNTSSLNTLFVMGTIPGASPSVVPILKLSPTKQPNVNYRYAYSYIDLSPFSEIRLYNQSSETFTNVSCTVLTG